MTCSSCSPSIDHLGANPANIQWCVVRGDTAKLRVQFFEQDESTPYSTETWTYIATAYDPVTKNSFVLDTEGGEGYVDIIAQPEDTDDWGTGYSGTVAELSFDVQVTIPSEDIEIPDTVWTPVIGTISVLADITLGGL